MYDEESESGSGWISWFCDLEGHEFFIEVSAEIWLRREYRWTRIT